ncbi:MAG TPA: cytochrome c oxidase subunit II [Longimicrobiales bacterium]
MSSEWRKALQTLALAALAVVWAGCAPENYPQSIFEPVTDFGVRINDLFYGIFWWTMLVLVIVESALVYILIRYRSRPGAEPRKIYGNNIAEIAWTLGPALIVVFILIPTVRTIFYTYEPPEGEPLVVEAIGHQWWWEFRYPELGVTTANQLHLPVGQPVEVRLSSVDVIHNFWVPQLGGKRYNYPKVALAPGEAEGRNFNVLYFTVEEPGDYYGQCAEFCGTSHALMRMRVTAQSPEDFTAWVAAMTDTTRAVPQAVAEAEAAAPASAEPGQEAALVAEGYQVFMRTGCAACHSITGTPAMGRIGPNLTGVGSRWAIGAGLMENTEENLARWVRNAPALKPGVKMPAFPNLSDADVEALVAYLSSLD